jgi:hypothetical protein
VKEEKMPSEPRFEFLFEMSALLEPSLQQLGETPHGRRIIGYVHEGSFAGPRLHGRLLAGGGDWLLVRPDGVRELDVRITLQTDDGALIFTTYRGYRVPRGTPGEHAAAEEDYYVVTPYFETSAPEYAWLQQVVTIGLGRNLPEGGLAYRIFAVR